MSESVDKFSGTGLPSHELINNVGEIFRTGRDVFGQAENNHAYRYVKMVETSTMGHDCKYALASHRLWINSGQREATIHLLETLRDAINDVLELADHGQQEKEDSEDGS